MLSKQKKIIMLKLNVNYTYCVNYKCFI